MNVNKQERNVLVQVRDRYPATAFHDCKDRQGRWLLTSEFKCRACGTPVKRAYVERLAERAIEEVV